MGACVFKCTSLGAAELVPAVPFGIGLGRRSHGNQSVQVLILDTADAEDLVI